jgi:hypothetical protein
MSAREMHAYPHRTARANLRAKEEIVLESAKQWLVTHDMDVAEGLFKEGDGTAHHLAEAVRALLAAERTDNRGSEPRRKKR